MSSRKSIYLRVYDELKILIRNRVYLPGDLLPSELELGKKYGASRPTIAKALNLLSEEKLVWRRAGFGTQVLEPGKGVPSIAMLIPQVNEGEIFLPICQSIAESAGKAGLRVIRVSEFDPNSDVREVTESLIQRFIDLKVDGVFFVPLEFIDNMLEFNLSIVEKLNAHGVRVVLADRDVHEWPSQTPYDLVGIDNIEAGFVMAEHLIGNNCKDLAFVSEPEAAMTVRLRETGVHEAMIQNGLRARDLIHYTLGSEQAKNVASEILKTKTTGVVCANDAIAARLLRALLDLGAEIPGKLQVCGFDDVEYASLLSVPLSSYRQPCVDIGRVAVATMVERIKFSNTPAKRITLKGRLVVRDSAEGAL